MHMSEIVIIISCVFLFSFLLTRYIISFATAKDIVDIPNDRSSHTINTPRGGGLSISLSLIICLVFIMKTHNNIPDHLLLFTFCIALITIIGIIDDLKGLSIKIRASLYVLISFVYISDLFFLQRRLRWISGSFSAFILWTHEWGRCLATWFLTLCYLRWLWWLRSFFEC